MKMKLAIKNLWLRALRSGEYKQTQGALKNGYGYCCLGVLCDLYTQETGLGYFNDNNFFEDMTTGFGERSSLPYSVSKWAGLKGHYKSNPCIAEQKDKYRKALHSLAEANDGGKTFTEIANIIEKQL